MALIQPAPLALTQDVPAPKALPAQAEFFSGTVVSFTATELVVYRKTLTTEAVTKTFLVDENTKFEGTLKVKARVTVRFAPDDPAMRAIEVIVR